MENPFFYNKSSIFAQNPTKNILRTYLQKFNFIKAFLTIQQGICIWYLF